MTASLTLAPLTPNAVTLTSTTPHGGLYPAFYPGATTFPGVGLVASGDRPGVLTLVAA